MNPTEPNPCTAVNARYLLRFPESAAEADQDQELCEIHLNGAWQRLRLHDYATIFSLPGLYEQLFYDVLQCSSPREVVSLAASVMRQRQLAATQSSAIDVGAGNGMVAEELHRLAILVVIEGEAHPEPCRWDIETAPGRVEEYLGR